MKKILKLYRAMQDWLLNQEYKNFGNGWLDFYYGLFFASTILINPFIPIHFRRKIGLLKYITLSMCPRGGLHVFTTTDKTSCMKCGGSPHTELVENWKAHGLIVQSGKVEKAKMLTG